MTQALHIVVPCYNPHEGWEVQLCNHFSDIKQYLPAYQIHPVVVNDASSTGIGEAQLQYLHQHLPNVTYITYPVNHGKGYALREGIKGIEDGLILYTDIDFPYEYESMVKIVQSLEGGSDIAIGTRDNEYYENTPLKRKWISKVLRFVFKVVFRLPITDTQCGLKGFNQRGKKVFMSTSIERFLFDMEFIAIASKTKTVKMEPVFVVLRSDVVFSKMNLKILTGEFWNFIKILRIVRRHQPYE
jgi:glycosyltransferase involved in cell wall biosynthesis